MKNKTYWKNRCKEYEELFDIGVGELKFEKMNNDLLLSTLNELLILSSGIEKKVIENSIERHNLDKIIHAKLLLTNK